jgi:hypothetical protein
LAEGHRTEAHASGVESAGLSGWLFGAIREGREITTSRSTLMPQRFDTTVPANRAKVDAVEQLAKIAYDAGLTMLDAIDQIVSAWTTRK